LNAPAGLFFAMNFVEKAQAFLQKTAQRNAHSVAKKAAPPAHFLAKKLANRQYFILAQAVSAIMLPITLQGVPTRALPMVNKQLLTIAADVAELKAARRADRLKYGTSDDNRAITAFVDTATDEWIAEIEGDPETYGPVWRRAIAERKFWGSSRNRVGEVGG
jgi:hypothetical protein